MNKNKQQGKKSDKIEESQPKSQQDSKNGDKSNKGTQSQKSQKQKKDKLKLHKIVLENFKSFEGKHEIGYFLNFSVVLGPNGSGKSNIIDAICFALNMKTLNLRTKNLKDLIYKREDEEDHNSTSNNNNIDNNTRACYVELVFQRNDEDLISFKKRITSRGTNEYSFNDQKINLDEYNKELEQLDIPTKAKYFILAQGAIDSILSKKNDLTKTIEYLCKSEEYKEDYDKLENEIKNLNSEINKISIDYNNTKDDRGKIKNAIKNESKYNEYLEKLNSSMEKMLLFKLAELDHSIIFNEDALNQNEISTTETQDDKKKALDFLKRSEEEIKKLDQIVKQTETGDNSFNLKVEQLNSELTQLNENIKLYDAQIFSKTSMFNQQNNEAKKRNEKKNQLINLISKLNKDIEENKSKIDKVPESDVEKNQVEEYKEIAKKLEMNTFQIKNEIEKMQQKLINDKNQKNIFEKNLNKIENDILSNETEKITFLQTLEIEDKNKEKMFIELNELKNKKQTKESEFKTIEEEYKTVNKLLQEKQALLSQYESENSESQKRKKISELMEKNSQIYGFLFELVTPLKKSFELPIKVAMLKFLGYLVVQTSETAKACSDFMISKEISAEVLVLANIPDKNNDEYSNIRLKLGNLGNLLIDLIDVKKKELKTALNFFLKDTVLCHDKANVEVLQKKGFKSIVLVDGTMLRKGAITGGNYRNLEQYNFNYKAGTYNYDELNKLRIETESLNQKILRMQNYINEEKGILVLINEIESKENLIQISLKNKELAKENLHKVEKSLEERNNALKQINENITNIESGINAMTDTMKEMEKVMNKQQESAYKDFLKKYKLQNLNKFESFSLAEIKRISEELKLAQEKVAKYTLQKETLEQSEETLAKLFTSLEEDKQKKQNFLAQKQLIEKDYKKAFKELENHKEEKSEEYKKMNAIKEKAKEKNLEIDLIDKRINSLLKNKIEFEHLIKTNIEAKKALLEQIEYNLLNYLKEQSLIDENYSVIINFALNVSKFIFGQSRNGDVQINYDSIETKRKVKERDIDDLRKKIESLKNKFSLDVKEFEKYVKLSTLNESDPKILEERKKDLGEKKNDLHLQTKALSDELLTKEHDFSKIKEKRKKKFEKFFKKLSEKIEIVYKNLTKPLNGLNPGGSAYIYTTNVDEPFLGDICYLPTPPGKRVIYDIDQLSGGEKTIAILSLVVAIQEMCETPFIILDEIDSYLDPEHEAVLETLFSNKLNNFQVIIVTHKSSIFRSANALIGTYFNKQKFSSIPITLDMSNLKLI